MKPDLRSFKSACPEVDERFLKEHLQRLSDTYFSSFPEKEIYRHARGLAGLSSKRPLTVTAGTRRDGSVDITVLAFDYPFEFSIITGILAGLGFSVLSGDIFTYGPAAAPAPRKSLPRRHRAKFVPDPLKRRRIIDHFTGHLETTLSFKAWAFQLKEKLQGIIGLMEKGGDTSTGEARHQVNRLVVQRLAQTGSDGVDFLYPVTIQINNDHAHFTRLRVIGEDNPAFLYALSNALSLNRVHIEHVRIRTIGSRIEDRIDLVNASGRKIIDPDVLDRVRLSVLLTKQFTYFLSKSPDPHAALSRFEQLTREVLALPEKGRWMELLANPHTLRDLARLLGASDYLWEDFIRLQYESLLPMFEPHVRGHRFSESEKTVAERLAQATSEGETLDERKRALNGFKDREIFLIDLDYILYPDIEFAAFSEKVSVLAESVVRAATGFVYEDLVARFGKPRTVAGIEARLAVMALGKLGGRALGYASDIELLYVYSDNGQTDGPDVITNPEFYDRLVKGVSRFIEAKREGIFHLDLRLRPYGSAGPLATSLENFCKYYGAGGGAHSFERLALVRLRAIGGDADFGAQLERLRDEMIYGTDCVDFEEVRILREKQFAEKGKKKGPNAKFSAGGLVDLEYGVQSLQVMYGKEGPELRSQRIHEALVALTEAGVLEAEEFLRVDSAYVFLRRLINGMRMLRGSAKDLFLPDPDSDEFDHLARRMGYEKMGGLIPGQQLRIDYETHTAAVRTFVERQFGRETLPDPKTGSVVDLVMSEDLPEEVIGRILGEAGFRNVRRAHANLKRLAGEGERRNAFSRLAVLAFDILSTRPDPDMALNNWERFIHTTFSPEFQYGVFLSQPMRLELLLSVFSVSQFLADTLIRNPGFLDWLTIPEMLHKTRLSKDLMAELRRAASVTRQHGEWLNKVRRFRRREILRIGTRDICLGVDTREVMAELSILADAITQAVVEKDWQRLGEEGRLPETLKDPDSSFCVMAFGKLGGNELNYSSDIDLLALYEDASDPNAPSPHRGDMKRLYTQIMEFVRSDLSDHTEEGYVYRVDLRLRPFGSSGDLVPSLNGLLTYYREKASLWEIQAAFKLRPMAGNLSLGYRFLEALKPLLLEKRDRRLVVDSIEHMRRAAIRATTRGIQRGTDVKSGFGGIRDIEFLVQGLQLIHAPENAMLLQGNTLQALNVLNETGILERDIAGQLREDYLFLRRIEHFLQILEDRQIHVLPKDPVELDVLSKKVLGPDATAAAFLAGLNDRFKRINDFYQTYLLGRKTGDGAGVGR
ncbi:[glutamate--ammonia-ligase] adenylyltransferase [delta proteobacterium NaphS2]|nr:[glutamate--ammonia-ligase] adenylyltransferase [delta proteobacterium NaphS2]